MDSISAHRQGMTCLPFAGVHVVRNGFDGSLLVLAGAIHGGDEIAACCAARQDIKRLFVENRWHAWARRLECVMAMSAIRTEFSVDTVEYRISFTDPVAALATHYGAADARIAEKCAAQGYVLTVGGRCVQVATVRDLAIESARDFRAMLAAMIGELLIARDTHGWIVEPEGLDVRTSLGADELATDVRISMAATGLRRVPGWKIDRI